jgi:hypothetical protein
MVNGMGTGRKFVKWEGGGKGGGWGERGKEGECAYFAIRFILYATDN